MFAGVGVVLFFLATAWLQGRQYFELAAMRFHSVAEAKALRRIHQTTVFIGGLFIAGFVSIPILNLATPLFGTALMVHVHKRLTAVASAKLALERRLRAIAMNVVFSGQRHRSLIGHFSHSGRCALQM